ncbi:cytochrome P450 9e2-like [Athalia rosae]|uniref:cytochrome P450 9e2-like n=1 Tax=Athalia rosae TaxID=37344 RepID=UPI00203360CB|nr:cytochrome P450 9e2-like [Athalia rosae]
MEYFWTLLVSFWAGVVGVYFILERRTHHFERRGVPSLKATPLIGNTGLNLFGRIPFAENVRNMYNAVREVKYVGIFDFVNPIVMLRDPELIKSVAIKNFDHFQDHRNFLPEESDPLFAKNLFFLQGDRWRDVRTLLSPAFTSSKMKMMFKLAAQCGTDLADHLFAKAERPCDIEMKDSFARYTNDVIATAAFGLSINSLENRENEFYTTSREVTNFSRKLKALKILILRGSPFLGRLLNIQIVDDKSRRFFLDVISSTIAMRDEKGIVRNDMIQLMMQARDTNGKKSELTTEEMTAQAFVFLLGGLDTSSTAMCFAAHEIGVNPEVQRRLHEEIDAVLAENEGEVTYEALHKMKYLDAVISETLRLYPPVPVIDRLCTKAFDLPPAAPGFEPYRVEAGDSLWIPFYGLHMDPKFFPNPRKFDPERFTEKNRGNVDSSAYMPFGSGPRSCIGNRFALMETKLAIFHLLAKCELSPCSRTSIPIKLDRTNFNMASENGFWLTIRRRT